VSITTPVQAGTPRPHGPDGDALLEVRNLSVDFWTPRGPVRAVDNVSLSIAPGEILGLAGESGCGKSTTGFAIIRLIEPPGVISGGQILLRGRDILAFSPTELRKLRWSRISMVFQSAMNALNPVARIGEQIVDAIRAHERVGRRQAEERAAELFTLVNIEPSRLRSYPHELSGGQRQRAVIAVALALNPELVIMDEPTTALDVVVQRAILREIVRLQARLGFSILFITHDLSLLIELSDRIAIMYAGKVVETAAAQELFRNPLHPYTVGLLDSSPSVHGRTGKLRGIPGTVPDLRTPPPGCRFADRCPRVRPYHRQVEPPLLEMSPGHWVACHLYGGGANNATAG